eukprot:4759015-Amphidinium_carterae.1
MGDDRFVGAFLGHAQTDVQLLDHYQNSKQRCSFTMPRKAMFDIVIPTNLKGLKMLRKKGSGERYDSFSSAPQKKK